MWPLCCFLRIQDYCKTSKWKNGHKVWTFSYNSALHLAATVNTDSYMPRDMLPNVTGPTRQPTFFWKLQTEHVSTFSWLFDIWVQYKTVDSMSALCRIKISPKHIAQHIIPIDKYVLGICMWCSCYKDNFHSEILKWLTKGQNLITFLQLTGNIKHRLIPGNIKYT